MDPANRIGGAPNASTSVPMPAATPSAPAAAPAAAGFNPVALILPMVSGKFSEWKDERMKSLRPMGSFLSRDKLSLPAPSEIVHRVRTNLTYFQTNYFVLFAVLGVYCVLTSPSLIFWLLILGGLWLYALRIRTTPFEIAGRELPTKAVIGFLAALTVFVFWFASIGNTIFWLLGASVCLVGAHSLFYTPVEVDEFGFGEGLPTTMPAAPMAALPAPATV